MENEIYKFNEGKCVSCGKDVPIKEQIQGILPFICQNCFNDY